MCTLVNLGPLGPIFAVAPGRFEPQSGSLRHAAGDFRRFEQPAATLPAPEAQPSAAAGVLSADEYLEAA